MSGCWQIKYAISDFPLQRNYVRVLCAVSTGSNWSSLRGSELQDTQIIPLKASPWYWDCCVYCSPVQAFVSHCEQVETFSQNKPTAPENKQNFCVMDVVFCYKEALGLCNISFPDLIRVLNVYRGYKRR